jgi:hypothetical protein
MSDNRFKTAMDFRKSLEARLQKEAKEKGVDLQRLRRQVAFDRLLARLFLQPEPPFFLKGGYAMELRLASARATKDIDLTYLQRGQKRENLSDDFILNDLRSLAVTDLGDYFSYTLGTAELDLDNAPYGGARYPVSSFIDGKLFVRFHLDVGGDILVIPTEIFTTPNWLLFFGAPAPTIAMISLEQQFAEKIHAYTLPREARRNSRVKDLIDIILLMRMRVLDRAKLAFAIHQVFKVRNTHALPVQLPRPPIEWVLPYAALAEECALEKNIELAFDEIASLYTLILNTCSS